MPEHRIDSPLTLLVVFLSLIGLTILTVSLSFVHLGSWHLAAGTSVGTAKAVLVALFFMELRKGSGLNWLAAGAAIFWLGVLHVLTLSDYWSRYWAAY